MSDIQTEHIENHRAKLTVTVQADRFAKAMRQAARRIAKKARIPGFRPGKAPYNVIVNLYGREYVMSEALETLGQEIYREALDASDITPYAPGSLDDVSEDEGVQLIFSVPKSPEVDLADYRSIRVEYDPRQVTDEMVNDTMENLRQSQAVVEDVAREARLSDQVVFAHIQVERLLDDDEIVERDDDIDDDDIDDENIGDDSTDENDEAADHTDADAASASDDEDDDDEDDEYDDEYDDTVTLIHQHNFERVLQDDENDLLPGFSPEIVGMSAGDEKTFTLTIPEEYDDDEVAGSTLICEVHVETVQSRTVPEWSDDLAKRISSDEQESILDLRMEVRKRIQEELDSIATNELTEEALNKLVEGAAFLYPDEVVDDYLDDLLDELDNNLRQQNLTLDDFLTITGQDRDTIREQYRDRAIERAERALALGELIRQEELSVNEDDVMAEIDRISQQMGGPEQADVFKQFLMTPQSQVNVSNQLVSSRALDRLAAIAKGEDPPKGPAPSADSDSPAETSEIAAPSDTSPAEASAAPTEDSPAEHAAEQVATVATLASASDENPAADGDAESGSEPAEPVDDAVSADDDTNE